MDYEKLAEQFLRGGHASMRDSPQRRIDDSMRGENFVLFFLATRSGSVTPGDLCAEMGVSTARVAATLNSLESKGLISRRIDPDDRRRVRVELTEAGRRVADDQRRLILARTTSMLQMLGEQDATELVRIWGRLSQLAPRLRADS